MTTGRCCCGATSVSVSGTPKLSAVCHCNDCRRRSGSAFGWSAYFSEAQVTGPEGNVAGYHPAIDAPQIRWFCRLCGTTVAWRTTRFPGLIGVAAGAFVEGAFPPPTITNRASACVAWLTLPAGWHHIG